jgi:hypothetical protein
MSVGTQPLQSGFLGEGRGCGHFKKSWRCLGASWFQRHGTCQPGSASSGNRALFSGCLAVPFMHVKRYFRLKEAFSVNQEIGLGTLCWCRWVSYQGRQLGDSSSRRHSGPSACPSLPGLAAQGPFGGGCISTRGLCSHLEGAAISHHLFCLSAPLIVSLNHWCDIL